MTREEAEKIAALYEEHDDTVYELSEKKDVAPDAFFEETSTWGDRLKALLCKLAGHTVGPDQCGKPEHDYCYRCGNTASKLGYVWKGGTDRWVAPASAGGEASDA